jgi:sporulation protein YlmC with PRC-barrel domain
VSEETTGAALLQRQVLLRGIRIGTPIDLVLDLDISRVVGIEVRCGDDVDRFLPFAVARMQEDAILLDSALELVEDEGLAFYRRSGTSLRSLQGLPVDAAAGGIGTLVDVVVGQGGRISSLAVERAGERHRVEVDASLSVGGRRLASEAA